MSTTTPPHTHVHVHQLTPYPIPEEEDSNSFPFPTLPIASASASTSAYTASSQQRVQAPSPWTMKHGFAFSSPPATPSRPLAFTRSSVGTGMGMGSLKQRPHATSHPSAHFALQPPQSPSEGGKIPPGLLLKRRSSVCSTASTGSSVGSQESLMSEKSWGNWEVAPASPPLMSSTTTTTRPELRERRRGSEGSDNSDTPDEVLITPQTDLLHSFEEDVELPISAKDGFKFTSSFGKNKMDLIHPASSSNSKTMMTTTTTFPSLSHSHSRSNGKRLFPPIETLFEEDEEPPILTVGLVRVGKIGRGRLFESSDRVIRLNPAGSLEPSMTMATTTTTMTPTTMTATIPKRPTFKRKITPRPGLAPLPPTTHNRFVPKHQDFQGFITEESEAESQSESEWEINDDPTEREEYKRGRSPTRRPAWGGDGRKFSSVLERGRVWVESL